MAWLLTSILVAVVQGVFATPDAQITAIAKLDPRQQADPSALGWLSTSGASTFSDLRRCDYPDRLTRSGSYAQCCEPGKPCGFFTSCSANTLFASAVKVPCDNAQYLGFCNTAVIVSTPGASSGESFLGCWATGLGTAAFTLVQDIGSAPTVAPTSGSEQASQSGSNSSSGASTATATSSSASTSGPSTSTGSAGSTPTSSNVSVGSAKPLLGIVGLFAGFLALL